MQLGSYANYAQGNWNATPQLGDEVGQLDVGVSCAAVKQYMVDIEVTCSLTDEAFAQWQLQAYSAINQAYLALQSAYQQAISQNQQALAATNYPGSSPAENTRVVQTELKREVLSLVTLRQFDPPTIAPTYAAGTTYSVGDVVAYGGSAYVSLQGANTGHQPDINPIWWSTTIEQYDAPTAAAAYNAATVYSAGEYASVGNTPYVSLQDANQGNQPGSSPAWWATNTANYGDPNLPPWSPQAALTRSAINFPRLFQQAPLVRFLEEGFEWDQMQYIFYPYYWNQKDEWFNLALREDPDYLFALFLRAGAARVVVPVRPGFEASFLYFLQTGQPWNGGSVPQVWNSNYVSIATEIAAMDNQPVSETLVPPTWIMRVPTTLTMLRPPITPPAYSAAAAYPEGAVISYQGTAYTSTQAPYEGAVGYQPGSVVSYSDQAYVAANNAYNAGTTYAAGAVATYNGQYYVSQQAANTGDQPDTSAAWWTATPNSENEPDTNPQWWTSTANTNNAPDASPEWWTPTDSTLPSWTLDPYLNVLTAELTYFRS